MSLTSCDVIASEFEVFAQANIPRDASAGQVNDMRRAFYGGALLVLNVHDVLADYPEDDALRMLGHIRAEAFGFALSQVAMGIRITTRESK